MKSLIIGGAGFVGFHLIRYLCNEGKQEVIVTKMPTENISMTENIQVLNLDILNRDKIVEVLEQVRPDYIFHLAAQSSVALSWENPALTIDVNIKGTVNILDALRESGIKARILLVGSGEEYGKVLENEIPIKENNIPRPGNIYAATKACQNMMGNIYVDAYKLDIIMVRAFNHIGPNQSPKFVVSDFCKKVAEIEAGKSEAVIKVGNLNSRRDFTDVRDVVRAYALLVRSGKPGETYNIGSGHAVRIKEILDIILNYSKVAIQVEVDHSKIRPVDIPIIEADITKVFDAIGWKPQINLEQTIKETLDYWREQV